MPLSVSACPSRLEVVRSRSAKSNAGISTAGNKKRASRTNLQRLFKNLAIHSSPNTVASHSLILPTASPTPPPIASQSQSFTLNKPIRTVRDADLDSTEYNPDFQPKSSVTQQSSRLKPFHCRETASDPGSCYTSPISALPIPARSACSASSSRPGTASGSSPHSAGPSIHRRESKVSQDKLSVTTSIVTDHTNTDVAPLQHCSRKDANHPPSSEPRNTTLRSTYPLLPPYRSSPSRKASVQGRRLHAHTDSTTAIPDGYRCKGRGVQRVICRPTILQPIHPSFTLAVPPRSRSSSRPVTPSPPSSPLKLTLQDFDPIIVLNVPGKGSEEVPPDDDVPVQHKDEIADFGRDDADTARPHVVPLLDSPFTSLLVTSDDESCEVATPKSPADIARSSPEPLIADIGKSEKNAFVHIADQDLVQHPIGECFDTEITLDAISCDSEGTMSPDDTVKWLVNILDRSLLIRTPSPLHYTIPSPSGSSGENDTPPSLSLTPSSSPPGLYTKTQFIENIYERPSIRQLSRRRSAGDIEHPSSWPVTDKYPPHDADSITHKMTKFGNPSQCDGWTSSTVSPSLRFKQPSGSWLSLSSPENSPILPPNNFVDPRSMVKLELVSVGDSHWASCGLISCRIPHLRNHGFEHAGPYSVVDIEVPPDWNGRIVGSVGRKRGF